MSSSGYGVLSVAISLLMVWGLLEEGVGSDSSVSRGCHVTQLSPLPATLQRTLHQQHRLAGDVSQEVWALVGKDGDGCRPGAQEPSTRGADPSLGHAGHGARQLCRPHWQDITTPHNSHSRGRSMSLSFFTFKMVPFTPSHCDLKGPCGSHPFGQCSQRNRGAKAMSTGPAARHLLHL